MRDGVPHLAVAPPEDGDGFDPRGFAQIAQAEPGHFWFAPRAALLRGLLDRHFPEARSLLEIGCGTGNVLAALVTGRSWDRAVGSELHAGSLPYARPRLPDHVELVQMDARHIPARDAFDVIGAFDVIEHIPDDVVVLAEMFRAVRPGGGAIVSVPQHPWLWSRADETARHVRRYRRGELELKMAGAGFTVVDTTSYASLLLPMMALSRMVARGRAQPPSREADRGLALEWAMPPILNTVLRFGMQAETWATARGMRWPLGGSRIVVGRRT